MFSNTLNFLSSHNVSSTNHLAPRYAISSIPPLPRPSSVQIYKMIICAFNMLQILSNLLKCNLWHFTITFKYLKKAMCHISILSLTQKHIFQNSRRS
jgi:hypothetical protein